MAEIILTIVELAPDVNNQGCEVSRCIWVNEHIGESAQALCSHESFINDIISTDMLEIRK